MGEHAARYSRLAERACRAGLGVIAHDLRGHGRSADAGLLGDLGPRGWDASVRDLIELGDALANENPGAKRVLFGHSMGSLLVRASLAQSSRSIAGCALSGSSVPSGFATLAAQALAGIESLRLGRSGQSPLLRWLVFGRAERAFRPADTRFDWLSRDREEVAAYASDPRCGFVLRAGSLGEMFGAIRRLERARPPVVPRELPILIFAGGDDPLSGRIAVERLAGRYHRMGFRRVETRVYPGTRHEALNDLDRQQVSGDLLAWISSCLGDAGG
jgi:alpha-beta hydrolase superfamily lysophospholipase